MGERVEFPSNGHACQGYLAGSGPAVVVIQEWWGLVPHIEDIVERFAKEGFLAIAPALFHGKSTKSPDEAGRLLMELDADRAERDIAGAGEYLLDQPICTSKTYGVVGFCMGGALAQYTATKENGKVSAAASFYGGFKKLDMDWNNLQAALLLIYAGNDKGVPGSSSTPARTTPSSTTRARRFTTPKRRRTRGGGRWSCSGPTSVDAARRFL